MLRRKKKLEIGAAGMLRGLFGKKKGEPVAGRAGFAVLCHVEKWFRK